MGKLINRIPGSCLLISSLPGSALRTHVESLGSLAMSTSILKALPGKLDIKVHSPSILYIHFLTLITKLCIFSYFRLAFQALQNLMQESDTWKEHVVRGM